MGNLLISLVVLVLAAAVVVLFAMIGELASRVPGPTRSWLRPLTDVRLGQAPSSWPSELAGLPERDRAVLLVLSPVCTSCRSIAPELVDHADWDEIGLVVSASAAGAGRDFIAEYALESIPHYVDEGGAWVRASFGLERSPTALVLRTGQPVAAYTFSDVDVLRSRMSAELDGVLADQEREVEKV